MSGVSLTRAEAASALGWLVAAGIDTLVEDRPFAWLAPAGPVAPRVEPPSPAEPAAINADSLSALAAALRDAHPPALTADGTAGEVMVVGERPTAADAAAGRVFADAAGVLLDKMLAAIGRSRGDTLLTNAVMWPGGTSSPAERAAAAPFLRRTITLARPRAILALGQSAATALTGSTDGINRQRGKWVEVDVDGLAVAVMPTFAPAHLLLHPGHKALAWADLCALRARLRS